MVQITVTSKMKQIQIVMFTLTIFMIVAINSARSVKPDCSYLGEKSQTDKFQRCIRRMRELQEIITLLCNFRRPEGIAKLLNL